MSIYHQDKGGRFAQRNREKKNITGGEERCCSLATGRGVLRVKTRPVFPQGRNEKHTGLLRSWRFSEPTEDSPTKRARSSCVNGPPPLLIKKGGEGFGDAET